MTALAEKVITESLGLTADDQLEVMSRLSIQNGFTDLHEQIENIIALRRDQRLRNGEDKGLTKKEVFGKYGL